MCLEMHPFLLDFQFTGVCVFKILPNDPFEFNGICCNTFFISNFVNLCLLFLLVSLDKGLSILFILSKNYLFVSLILCIILLIFISLISALMFVISFLLLILEMTRSFWLYICVCSKTIQWGKRQYFQQIVLGKLYICMQENEGGSLPNIL
jgi:hypothetical protein